jgi:sugar phosphate permease
MVMLIGYIGYYLCRKNLSAAFPLMSDEFGFSNSQLGLIALYSEVVYAIGKFINGPLGDKIGGKKIFLLGMFGAIVSNVAFSFGHNLIYFIVVWSIARYFLSMGWGGLAKVIGSWYGPSENGTVMGVISISFQFGGVVATLFAGYLVSLGLGWKAIFIYPPMVLTAIMIYSFFAAKNSPQEVDPDFKITEEDGVPAKALVEDRLSLEDAQQPTKIIQALLKMSIYRQLLVFSFLTTFLRSIFFFWTPKLLVDLGMGTTNAILKSALFPLLGSLGTILLGWYTDRYAKHDRAQAMWIMLLGLVLSLLGVAFLSADLAHINKNLIVLLTGLCGFFLLGPYSMSSGSLTLDIAGAKAAGSCTGIIDGLGYLGGALAVWSAGKLSDVLGWSQVFYFLAAGASLAMIAAFFMSREFRRIHRLRATD